MNLLLIVSNSENCEVLGRYPLDRNRLRKREFVERASSLLQGIFANAVKHDTWEVELPRRPQKPAAMSREGGIIVS